MNKDSQKLVNEFFNQLNRGKSVDNICIPDGLLFNEGPMDLIYVPDFIKDYYGNQLEHSDFNFYTFDDIEKDNKLKHIAAQTLFFDNRQILGIGQLNGKEVVVIIIQQDQELRLLGLLDKGEPMLTILDQKNVEPNHFLDSLNLEIFIPPNFEGPTYYGDKNGMISYTVGSNQSISEHPGYINFYADSSAQLFINSFPIDTTRYTNAPKTILEGTLRWIGAIEASDKGRITDVTMKFTSYGCLIDYNMTIEGQLFHLATSGLEVDGNYIFVTMKGTEQFYQTNAFDYFITSESLNSNR